ncbi:MAG: T9SS type A sorting domain-containing protein [Ignavibacteria bacterium]|nr:T9SS type A sorting domain-containing protein [Ignavibacteria bacterium]
MIMKNILTVIFSFYIASCQGLPNTVKMTPIKNVPLFPKKIIVAEKYKNLINENLFLNVPAGYSVKVFYTGRLNKARFLTWGPDSVLYVANKTSGEILALPDRNRDGVADTVIVAASGFYKSHDVKFYNGAMYVAEERKIVKCVDNNGDGIYETKTIFIDNIASGSQQPGGGHDTRTIVFNPQTKKMYLSIGSYNNVARETFRAIIEEYNDDGTGRRTFATGIRNAVGMTLRNGKLWANNNGSDWQGDNVPPEWIDVVRDDGFYGHPFAYANGVYFNFAVPQYTLLLPITSAESLKIKSMHQPAALIQAHSAPMQIISSNKNVPTQFQNGMFTVLRGSWNRTYATGFKVIYLDLDNENDTTANYVSDFITGFLTDSIGKVSWGRPVGLELDQRGTFYLTSDDITEAIFSISPTTYTYRSENIEPTNSTFELSQNYPNPFNPNTIINYQLPISSKVILKVYDVLGKEIANLVNEEKSAGAHNVSFNSKGLVGGIYFYSLKAGNENIIKSMLLLK